MAGVKVTLSGNFTKLDELKGKANSTAASIRRAFGSDFGKKAFAGLAAGATAAIAAVTAATVSAIKAGGELSDMVTRTGADGAKLVVLQRAFQNAGLAATQLPAVLNKMQKALAGVNDEGQRVQTRVFNDLGLSIEELRAADPADAFAQMSEALARIEDPAQRAALAMEIFGRSGGELLVLMRETGAFERAEKEVGALARTLAANADEFDYVADSMSLFQVKLQQLGAGVAVELLPQLIQLSDWFAELDLTSIGNGLGEMVSKTAEWGEALAQVAKFLPVVMIIQKEFNAVADRMFGGPLTDADRAKARAMAESHAAKDPNYMKGRDQVAAEKAAKVAANQTAAESRALAADAAKAARDAERAADAAERKAVADAEAAAERAKTRAAAMEEYNLESELLDARIAGDEARIAAAERELKIRREIAALVSQGFTAKEARRPAEAKVDAEARAAKLEQDRRAAADAKAKADEEGLRALEDLTRQRDALRFQSTIGAISAMQRVGGGGGAVSSGLDYQRQATDLTREILGVVREMSGKLPRPQVDY